MPLHPDFQKIYDKMVAQYGAKKGKSVFYAWVNQHEYDDTKPFPGKKEGVEQRFCERLRFTAPFVVEAFQPVEIKEGQLIQEAGCRKIRGTMLKATTSRNGRTYTMENIEKAKFTSDTLSLNHTEDVTDNVGTFTPHITSDGINFEAVIYNTGKHPYVTDMIDKGLIKFTSIEAIAGELVKEGDQTVAKDLDITGLGLVKTPGIPEATFAIAEAFGDDDMETESKLTYAQRQELPDSAFVYPAERKYPIHDITHARNALARVSANGTPEEQKKVRAAVYRKYPELKKDDEESLGDKMEDVKENTPPAPITVTLDSKEIVESIKTLTDSISKKQDEQIEALKKEIISLKESKSKGIVTDERKPPFRLKMETMKDGLKEFYSPEFLY
jgi:hypothetical protein